MTSETKFTRRRALRAGLLAALAVGACTVAAPAGAALPTVDMEAVLKAAQIDPRRADTAITPGSGESVLLVEQALAAKGMLAAQYVDGHFGTSTVAAYADYQKSLGYTGLDASGFPGPTSLQKLGTERYTVTHLVSAGSRVSYRGVTVNTRTKAMLTAAEGLLGRQLSLTQGSYNAGGVSGSAGTHDGGGALDISVSGMSTDTRTAVLKALRTVGFAAWLRTPDQADWGYHIHAIALADPDLSTEAQHQAGDYYLGYNGLAGRGPDDGPKVTPIRTWEEYQRG
ncbi:peptidoglycan-binding domain-containing protein [Amycolatopsis sacchari]|uniref:peptidoglycan-binding domain-containing protein n=1 Tax=Amycolatopsis sacchari TaxID=115433 RepID=UPI003D70EC76